MLAAECGDDQQAAAKFAQHFDGQTFQVAGEDPFETVISSGPDLGELDRWWAVVCPSGLARNGGGTSAEWARMTRVGNLLYDRLRSAPPVYRYAVAGLETYDWRTAEDLGEILLHPSVHGLVLSEQLWQSYNSLSQYIQFEAGYRWRPYLGEGRRA